MFWGKWKKTECFSSADFSEKRTNFAGIALEGNFVPGDQGLTLKKDACIALSRNFELDKEESVRMVFSSSGPLCVNGISV